jgi:hypothetical protein
MDIKPTPEFCTACRIVLGGDDPATVLTAIREDDPRFEQVLRLHAEIVAETATAREIEQGDHDD